MRGSLSKICKPPHGFPYQELALRVPCNKRYSKAPKVQPREYSGVLVTSYFVLFTVLRWA
jgi:hypothetical protein